MPIPHSDLEESALPLGPRWVENPKRDLAWTCDPVDLEVREFHRSLSGYAPTNLIDLPVLADEFGVHRVFAKDESNRFGLPAFKALGASWAIHRALRDRGGPDVDRPVTLVAATDGNHGRAVARFARQSGQAADIFVPDGVHQAAVEAIRSEGARVTLIPGSYDEAVLAAGRHADVSHERLLIQDTAWEGYEDVPRWIVDGYSTLFGEIDDQLSQEGFAGPTLMVVPTGVGSLLQTAIRHYRSGPSPSGTAVVSVEPTGAACVLCSVKENEPVIVDTGTTVMAGLNCGTMSSAAWPYVSVGLDGCLSVTDAEAIAAGHDLATMGLEAGPCGAAALAAMRVLNRHAESAEVERRRSLLGLSSSAIIVLLITEGAGANPWGNGG